MPREPPRSLAELQSMTTDEFRAVDRYLYQGNLSKKRVLEHLIELASRELSWQGRQNANSLRDFWYNPTKAILEAAFPDWGPGPGSSDWNREMSKRLSSTLSEMVKDGRMTYRDLNILDDSRDRELNPTSIESDKILFVEKSAAYRKLKPLEQVYDISLVEGSGWQATALIEDMVHELDPSNGPFHVWILTDYDPTGFDIARDFLERAQMFGLGIAQDSIEDIRIGVNPDHLDDDQMERQRFSVGGSGDRVDRWKRQYGIGPGGEYGLEIEAVGTDLEGKAEALRRLVVNEIRDDIRETKRRARDTRVAAATAASSGASWLLDDITGSLETALKNEAADIMSDQPNVSAANYDPAEDSLTVRSGDDIVDVPGDCLVPQPYDEGVLHDAAVSGDRPDIDASGKADQVRDELRERIQAGDIDVQDLLDI